MRGMDNISHSLVGLAVAEGVVRARNSKLRGPLYAASLAANNIPDLDFIYARFLSQPVGYILHHRGYTHTLVAILPQALVLLLGFFVFARWKKQKWERQDWLAIVGLVFAGLGLHILLDGLNSYGIHPFWPWNNTWYYLDAVFIVEPMLWLALSPMLAVAAPGRWRPALYWGIFVAALALIFYVPTVPLAMKIFYSLCGFGFGLTAYTFNPMQRVVLAVSYCVIFVSTLVILSQGVAGSVRTRLEQLQPDDNIVDIVRSPQPGNLLCWDFFALGSSAAGDAYWVKSGRFHMPLFARGEGFCDTTAPRAANVPLQPLGPDPVSQAAGIQWVGSFVRPMTELHGLSRAACLFGAFLQFARVPFWVESGEKIYFGDMRFDRNSSKGFSEFETNVNAPCPENLPGWRAPIHDLLGIVD